MSTRCDLDFYNSFATDHGPAQPRILLDALATPTQPLAFSQALLIAHQLEDPSLNPAQVSPTELLALLRGENTIWPSPTWATNYAGHQFGQWAGQLGDGRAISIAQFKTSESPTLIEWQLKGSGITAFSRGGDGRAVLRSSLREYVLSHAFHALNIASTQAPALAITQTPVTRDLLYDGHAANEPGAICLRSAPSFLRFGHIEWLAWRNQKDLLKQLLKWFSAKHDTSNLQQTSEIIVWFDQLCLQTIELVVQWMGVGFIHGVMNTDNMSLHGLTIDFGPFGWLNQFDPDFTPNTSDFKEHRYAYGKQLDIAIWNLSCLAAALNHLVGPSEEFTHILHGHQSKMQFLLLKQFAKKLYLDSSQNDHLNLIQQLFPILANSGLDYTLFFRWLEQTTQPAQEIPKAWTTISYSTYPPSKELISWLQKLTALRSLPLDQKTARNPLFIARNHLLYQCIQEIEQLIADPQFIYQLAAQQNNPSALFPQLTQLITELKHPFDRSNKETAFFQGQTNNPLWEKSPPWSFTKPGCNQLSCSS